MNPTETSDRLSIPKLLAASSVAPLILPSRMFGCGADDAIGPIKPSASAKFSLKDAIWNTATKFRVDRKHPNDLGLVITGGHPRIRDAGSTIPRRVENLGQWTHIPRSLITLKPVASHGVWMSIFLQLVNRIMTGFQSSANTLLVRNIA